MKKRIVIKLSGQVFSMDQTKLLKDYATFFVKKSKTYQPVIVAGGGKIARYFISHARSSRINFAAISTFFRFFAGV